MRNRLWVRTILVTIAVALVVFGQDEIFGNGGAWTAKASIPTPRSNLAVGVVNGILYAVGGSIVHTVLAVILSISRR
jgi:hypothetical protein